MKVAILDTETTSADPTVARPWEVAALLVDDSWNVEKGITLRMWAEDYPDISEGAMRACKIDTPRLYEVPTNKYVLERILKFLEGVDVIVAYNAQFDKTVLEAELLRCAIPVPTFQWLCAMNDIQYADHYRCKQLSHLALDHGIIVDPSCLHGALGDCHLLADLLKKGGYKADKMLEYRNEPWVFLAAELEKPWGPTEALAKKQQAEAKADGYSWQKPRGFPDVEFQKVWVKAIKQSQLEAEKEKKFSFKRSVINNEKSSRQGHTTLHSND